MEIIISNFKRTIIPLSLFLTSCTSGSGFSLLQVQSSATPTPTPVATATPTLSPLQFSAASVTIPAAAGFQNPAPTWDSAIVDARRDQHTSSLITIGTGANAHSVILVVGGEDTLDSLGVLKTAMIYDPTANTWTSTVPMVNKRIGHSASVIKIGSDLHDAVLVVGGFSDIGFPLVVQSTAEIYDPTGGAGGTPAWITAHALNVGRGWQTQTVLANNKVLITGGSNDYYNRVNSILNSAELYDPVANTWTTQPAMSIERQGHSASLIKIGTDQHEAILVVGGNTNGNSSSLGNTAHAEIYDPAAGPAWVSAGNLANAFAQQMATVLADGSVLITGGIAEDYSKYNDSYIYVPSHTGTPSTTWTMPGTASYAANYSYNSTPYGLIPFVLPNGKVMSIGGKAAGGTLINNELYDPTAQTWSAPASFTSLIGRYLHTANFLRDGRIVVYGGVDNSTPDMLKTNATEIYQTYVTATPSPTSGVAPYTYALTSGTGKLSANGQYVPNQFTSETATITATDSLGATGTFTVITTP